MYEAYLRKGSRTEDSLTSIFFEYLKLSGRKEALAFLSDVKNHEGTPLVIDFETSHFPTIAFWQSYQVPGCARRREIDVVFESPLSFRIFFEVKLDAPESGAGQYEEEVQILEAIGSDRVPNYWILVSPDRTCPELPTPTEVVATGWVSWRDVAKRLANLVGTVDNEFERGHVCRTLHILNEEGFMRVPFRRTQAATFRETKRMLEDFRVDTEAHTNRILREEDVDERFLVKGSTYQDWGRFGYGDVFRYFLEEDADKGFNSIAIAFANGFTSIKVQQYINNPKWTDFEEKRADAMMAEVGLHISDWVTENQRRCRVYVSEEIAVEEDGDNLVLRVARIVADSAKSYMAYRSNRRFIRER